MGYRCLDHETLSLDRITEFPDLETVFALWQGNGQARSHQIDVLHIPRALLPYVALIENCPQQGLVFRLAGTAICHRMGRELRGVSVVSALSFGDAAGTVQPLCQVLETRQPDLAYRSFQEDGGRFWSYVRLVLPLAGDDGNIDRLMVSIDPSTLFEKHLPLTARCSDGALSA